MEMVISQPFLQDFASKDLVYHPIETTIYMIF